MKPLLIAMMIFYAQLGHTQTAPFDKLKKLYETSAAPKSLAAAETAVASMTNCAEANSASPGQLSSPNRLQVLSYSTPDQGPEFPSLTTRLIAVLEVGMDTPSASSAMDDYRPVLSAQELQLDTRVYSTRYKCSGSIDDDICWDEVRTANAKLNIKLSPKYVLYQLDRDTYGYCWKQ